MADYKDQIKAIHEVVCKDEIAEQITALDDKLDKILKKLAVLEKLEQYHNALGEEMNTIREAIKKTEESVKSKRTKMTPTIPVTVSGDKTTVTKEKKEAGYKHQTKFNAYMAKVDDDYELFKKIAGMDYDDAVTKFLKIGKKYSKQKKEDLPEEERVMHGKYVALVTSYDKNAKDRNSLGVHKEMAKIVYTLKCVKLRNPSHYEEYKAAIEEHCK